MPIRAGSLLIPDSDLTVAFIKSGGPGGQNVNKVSSAVQLRFDLAGCTLLDEPVKARLRRLAGRRLTDEGAVLLVARGERSQEQNRRDAEARLAALIEAALVEPKLRRPTRPTRASKQRRLEHKTRRSSIKRARGRPSGED
jgi:ribosome-associated protein